MAGGVVDLGGSGVVVPDMGLGGWQWGDKGRWGFGTGYGPSEIADAFLGALEGHGRFFDTAEVYGHGTSEQVLGWMAARVPEPLVLATKFAPLPGRGGVRAAPEALCCEAEFHRRLTRCQSDVRLRAAPAPPAPPSIPLPP